MKNPVPVEPFQREAFEVMEKSFRAMGMFDAANRARLKHEALTTVVASGRTGIYDCEWYDRGRSEMPGMAQDEKGGDVLVTFGPITVALQGDQMAALWTGLTLAMFPYIGDSYGWLMGLRKAFYDEEGDILVAPFQPDSVERMEAILKERR